MVGESVQRTDEAVSLLPRDAEVRVGPRVPVASRSGQGEDVP